MVPALREAFNRQFTNAKYEAFLKDLKSLHPGTIEFRIAETPVFADKEFTGKMLGTCESIIDFITDHRFRTLTERAIPVGESLPGENDHCQMIAFDFGVCENSENELEPQLIEMQGFPSLFAFQVYYPELLRHYFTIPANYSHYLHGYEKDSFLKMLRQIILGPHPVENVILLEIKPHEQKTRIDFYCTHDYIGIEPVCITELIADENKLYYMNKGRKTEIRRIYNRVIFDDLHSQKESLGDVIDLTKPWEVEWIPHPNWFYRISKFTLPFIHHPFVPKTYFLNEVKQIPPDLEKYVLKPLFSFAGQGVLIDIEASDLEKIHDPQNWILQRKVKYADVIPTPDIPAKVEIRLMYLWPDGDARPHAAINLARLSKGKMIGVRYNKDKEWVGGSVCYFEK